MTEDTPLDPISPYGVAKLAAERYCIAFSRVYEALRDGRCCATSTSSARGRARTREYAAMMPRFLIAVMRGEPITIDGDGEQSRDFTYVANVVDATLRARRREGHERPRLQRLGGRAGDGERGRGHDRPHPRQAGRAPPRRRRAWATSATSWADVTAARETLGWEPTVGLEEGLRLTADALG